MNKKRVVNKAKSYSPVVKKRSLRVALSRADELEVQRNALQQQVVAQQQAIGALEARNEDWAKEVRSLRLELQRLKEYEKWLAMNHPSPQVVAMQRQATAKFKHRPLISIIVPVYNTEPKYLSACLDSVLAQSYTKWQLCIVDDASTRADTRKCLNEYSKRDVRIKLKRSTSNQHISVASNAAIDMAEGEYVALLDHDDLLWPNALYEVVKLLQDHPEADFIYSDEDKIDADGLVHFAPYFKPDWSPHLLECINYITHFSVLRKEIVVAAGKFDKNLVGAQDWDLFLRVTERTDKIFHVPTILYSWRAHDRSTAMSMQSKGYATASQRTALQNHFSRNKQEYDVTLNTSREGFVYPVYGLNDKPLVSIVIPTKDKVEYLKRCITSILEKTTYSHYEIVIVDTGSQEAVTKEYYQWLNSELSPKRFRIKYWRHKPFNYSDACNFGAKHARGSYLVMLNNDTEIISENWLSDMLGYAQQPEIGAVGAKLLYPTKQIQHAGVVVGIGSMEPVAGHIGIYTDADSSDYLTSLYTNTVRDTTAVTAACLMISTEKFWQVGGFDPIFRVTFNDVDLCLKIRKAGYLNIYLSQVELYHHESVSVGRVNQNRDMTELNASAKLIRKRWPGVIDHDPYYNKNFYILSSNFGLAIY